MKRCSRCGLTKPVSDFFTRIYKGKRSPVSACKTCSYQRDKERGKLDWDRQRPYQLKHHFGITVSEYEELWEKQAGRCAICGTSESHRTRDGRVANLSVDHSHRGGAIRGLLCRNCNRGLGFFGDDPDRLEAAIHYLKRALSGETG